MPRPFLDPAFAADAARRSHELRRARSQARAKAIAAGRRLAAVVLARHMDEPNSAELDAALDLLGDSDE